MVQSEATCIDIIKRGFFDDYFRFTSNSGMSFGMTAFKTVI